MTKELTPKPKEIKPGIRFTPELHAELQEAATRNGRTLQAEVIARVKTDRVDEIKKELAELKGMQRQVLDQVRDLAELKDMLRKALDAVRK